MKGFLPLLGVATLIGARASGVIDNDDEDDFSPPEGVKFKSYPPERTPKIIRWSNGVVTNCRNPKHLAFTFDDGIKYYIYLIFLLVKELVR